MVEKKEEDKQQEEIKEPDSENIENEDDNNNTQENTDSEETTEDENIEDENIYSAASCTTNAISPVLKVIEDNFGVESGHIETIHAYTNDQNLLDNFHKKPRRGRSAAINMVITSTGAGKAVTKVIPSLAGKLTSNAVRVPTPNGSLAIIKLTLNKKANKNEINDLIRNAAIKGDLVNQIKFEINPIKFLTFCD